MELATHPILEATNMPRLKRSIFFSRIPYTVTGNGWARTRSTKPQPQHPWLHLYNRLQNRVGQVGHINWALGKYMSEIFQLR